MEGPGERLFEATWVAPVDRADWGALSGHAALAAVERVSQRLDLLNAA